MDKLPSRKEINAVFLSFSKKERVIFFGLVIILLLSTISIVGVINKSFMVPVPVREGSVSVGIVGVPRFINPVLATSDADQDVTSLIYSGLMRKNNGTLILDLAEKYEMSDNGLIYTFTLKDDLYFHDGTPLTVEDVIFTINSVKDSIIKSPHKINWDGVSVEALDEKTLKFTLRQPHASFLLNTTLGIMPMHLWDDSPMELNNANTNPVGSGPYLINKINKQSSGIIDYYELKPFKKFILGEPYIKKMDLYFYANENDMISALENKTISQLSSIAPLNAERLKEKNYQIESSVLPRVFGLFFNQNVNQIFTDKAVVRAINQVIDKERIVRDVLFGYGVVLDSPIPPNMIEYQQTIAQNNLSREEILKKAQSDLAKAGWVPDEDGFLQKTKTENKKRVTTKLEFSISTGNVEELAKTAELIKQDLEAIGIRVDVKTFEIGNLNQNVIRPRAYDALLFGQIINQESDLFAFWHSSQRRDPGLNVAMYTNIRVDKLLEDAFITIDEENRTQKYLQFAEEIQKDIPAVFLYSPNFIYVVPKNLKQVGVDQAISSSGRYANAYLWYTRTENVWKIFTQ
ncbi:MAG: ABC transporter substrate-binding protein [Candidatus Paceibacterota bacterium]